MAKIKVDFTGVESFIKCGEGEHVAVLKSIEEKVSSTGNEMLEAVFEVTKGSSTGARVYDNFVLTEKALWKLKGFLEVIGMKADGKMAIDLNKLVGRVCIIAVIHEEYNGSLKSKIDSYRKFEMIEEPDEDEDDDDEEEAPPVVKKGKKKPPVVEDDDYEEEDEDEEPEETPKQKKARLKAEAEAKKKAEEEAAKKKKKKKPTSFPPPEDDDDDDDDWDED